MAYLIAQISLFLVFAAGVGFVAGWIFRGIQAGTEGQGGVAASDQLERAKSTARIARAELAARSERLSQVEERLVASETELSRTRGPAAGKMTEKQTPTIETESKDPASPAQEVEEVLAAAGIAASTAPDDLEGKVEIEEPVVVEELISQPIEDLTLIRGVGPATAKLLKRLGYSSIQQIAAWSDSDIERVTAAKASLAAKITRDDWIEQARTIAART